MPQLFNGESLRWNVVRGVFISFFIFIISLSAEPEKEKSLLLKNVVLIDDEEGDDQLVSLLIEEGVLEVVTVDWGLAVSIVLMLDSG